MADRSVQPSNTFEQFRTSYNGTAQDVGDIASLLGASGIIASSTDIVEAVVALNNSINNIDVDISGDTGTISILDSETLTIAGGTGISTSGSSNQITIATSADVVTLTGTQTLTNKTLTSPTLNSPTITTLTATQLALTDASIVFEGATADAHETTLTVVDPTADRTITLPNETGTLITSASAATNAFSIALAAALG